LAKGFAGAHLTREAGETLKRLETRIAPAGGAAAAGGEALPFGVRVRLGTTQFRRDGYNGAAAFSADGQLLAGLSEARGVYLWEASDGSLRAWELWGHRETLLWKTSARTQALVGFSPTGGHVVVADENKPQVFLVDVHKQLLQLLPGLERSPDSLSFSLDGKY